MAFTGVGLGPSGTGIADTCDTDLATQMFQRWHAEGYMNLEPITVEWVAVAEP